MKKIIISILGIFLVPFSVLAKEVKMPEIPPNKIHDIHGIEYVNDADLKLFLAGNQFMVMPELIKAFQKKYPEVRKIYYETLPPGLLLKQILAGGAKFRGQVLPGDADIFASTGEKHLKKLVQMGRMDNYYVYIHNVLALIVKKGNPKNIKSVEDLAKPRSIVISHPNPVTEGICRFAIEPMWVKLGGEDLKKWIMEGKVKLGTTKFTKVHHRENLERLKSGEADVGIGWITENYYHISRGEPVETVKIDPKWNVKANYAIGILKDSKRKENAEKFLKFILSEEAQNIYKKYGFIPASYEERTIPKK